MPRSPDRPHLTLFITLTLVAAGSAAVAVLATHDAQGPITTGIAALMGAPARDDPLADVLLGTLPVTIYDEQRPFEPSVAADPNDDQHLVAAAMSWETDDLGVNTVWLQTHLSRDGGATWTTTRFPGGPSAGPTHPLFAYDHISDPALAMLPDGTVLLAAFANQWHGRNDGIVAAHHSGGGALFVARSHDGGATWPDVEILRPGVALMLEAGLLNDPTLRTAGGVLLQFNDKPWMAVGADGDVLLVWADLQFPPITDPLQIFGADLWFAISRNSGDSWTDPQLFVDGFAYPALPAILSDGGLRVAFRDALTDGKWEMSSSDDDGATWERHTILPASEIGPMANTTLLGPTLVLQRLATHDRLVLPFNTAGPEAQTQVLKFITSDDRGETWTAPAALDTPTTSVSEPFGPFPMPIPSAAATDAYGNVYVTYFHVPEGTDAADFKIVRITDGEPAAPRVLETATKGHPYLRGHYMGMAGLSQGAYPVWITGACGLTGPVPCSLVGARVDQP